MGDNRRHVMNAEHAEPLHLRVNSGGGRRVFINWTNDVTFTSVGASWEARDSDTARYRQHTVRTADGQAVWHNAGYDEQGHDGVIRSRVVNGERQYDVWTDPNTERWDDIDGGVCERSWFLCSESAIDSCPNHYHIGVETYYGRNRIDHEHDRTAVATDRPHRENHGVLPGNHLDNSRAAAGTCEHSDSHTDHWREPIPKAGHEVGSLYAAFDGQHWIRVRGRRAGTRHWKQPVQPPPQGP